MRIDLLPQQQIKASPALIALNNMLLLSTVELQQLVQQEIEANPALEQDETDDPVCMRCGRLLNDGLCVYCIHEDMRLTEAERDENASAPEADEFDPLLMVAASVSLRESLERDLNISLPESDHPIARYLLGLLDGQGLLDGELDEIADVLQVERDRVEVVLYKIQELGPPGVGARTVQECLLIQIDHLERSGVCNPHVRAIVTDHWLDLGEHRYGAIAKALGISYDSVVAARDFMRQHLRLFPFERSTDHGRLSDTAYLVPDVIIRAEGASFIVEVTESRRSYLRINPLYQSLARVASQGQEHISVEEREHLRTFVSRARLFLNNMQQRRETIRRIAVAVCERQHEFLRHGIRHLVPLTRADVAATIGVHESTVSRATANKSVQLPNREIIPFSHVFTASLSVKDVIGELVSNEKTPLTDDEIVDILHQRGFDVARRTVAKYRTQLGILPSTLR